LRVVAAGSSVGEADRWCSGCRRRWAP